MTFVTGLIILKSRAAAGDKSPHPVTRKCPALIAIVFTASSAVALRKKQMEQEVEVQVIICSRHVIIQGSVQDFHLNKLKSSGNKAVP